MIFIYKAYNFNICVHFFYIIIFFNIYIHFKQLVIDGIKDLIDELETQQQNIANQALEHIHSKYI